MRSIRIFARNMGDPYYEPTIVVHDKSYFLFRQSLKLGGVSILVLSN